MSPARRRNVRIHQREASRERCALESRFAERIEVDHRQASLVTARRTGEEPFHRWSAYRQGFSSELVRRFLAESGRAVGPVLDPFNGSGTTTTECGRRGVFAIGMEAMAALAFLAASRALKEVPDWPGDGSDTFDVARLAAGGHPAHRAAALFALARTTDGEGHRVENAAAPAAAIDDVLRLMREDVRTPLAVPPALIRGDARRLPIAAASIGGILTSPPYLSRYDYARVNASIEQAHSGRGRRTARRTQVRASPVGTGAVRAPVHPAVREAAVALAARGESRHERAVLAYFDDLERVLAGCASALVRGAPLWMVVAGALPKGEYVPADLILAERAEAIGLEVDGIVEARRLGAGGRTLGDLHDVAPREVILRLRRR